MAANEYRAETGVDGSYKCSAGCGAPLLGSGGQIREGHQDQEMGVGGLEILDFS